MEIDLTYLKDIIFPVFAVRLNGSDIHFEDGLVFVGDRVLDDKNQKYPMLGMRRLHSPHACYPLKRGCENLKDLIQSKDRVFIDSAGKIFKYTKTKYCKVESFRLKKVISQEFFSILVLPRNIRFKVARPPSPLINWVNVVMYKQTPLIIYDYSVEQEPTRRRKI